MDDAKNWGGGWEGGKAGCRGGLVLSRAGRRSKGGPGKRQCRAGCNSPDLVLAESTRCGVCLGSPVAGGDRWAAGQAER
jgi:hypothetical protein